MSGLIHKIAIITVVDYLRFSLSGDPHSENQRLMIDRILNYLYNTDTLVSLLFQRLIRNIRSNAISIDELDRFFIGLTHMCNELHDIQESDNVDEMHKENTRVFLRHMQVLCPKTYERVLKKVILII
jgi:hypothetical protein